ncbi:MAG: c-type cytochrome [Acidobacteriota bacterium]
MISHLYYLNYFNEPGDEIAGRELFFEKGCIKCHSIASQGGNIGPPLDKFKSDVSTLSIAQAMWNHSPDMVARMADLGIDKPYFKQKEMANLLTFIRSQAADSVPDEKFLLPGSPLSGQRLFAEKSCIRCHSIYGRGGRIGPDLSRKGYYGSGASIVGAMWNHDSLMSLKAQEAGTSRPAFSKSEMADIIAYLYFIRSTDIAGDASTGKRLFEQKGCAQCHSTRQGEQIGPDLSTSDASISPVKLAAAMWNHVPVAGGLMEEKGLHWPMFNGDEMGDLIAYLKSIARRPTDQAIKLQVRR